MHAKKCGGFPFYLNNNDEKNYNSNLLHVKQPNATR